MTTSLNYALKKLVLKVWIESRTYKKANH